MQPWQLAFLGQHELPRELTAFELGYFFSFNDAERRAIRTRRRPLNQLSAALHLGFMKMSGCALDAFEMVPRSLLTHLGREFGIEVPTVTSVRALYRRRATLFQHQRWAAEILGFSPTSEHQRRALTGLIKQESYKALSAAQLVTFARRWCYEHKLLIPGERTLSDLVRTAIPQAERELLDAVEKAIPAAQRSQWLDALGSMRSARRSVLEWLQGEPGKPSRQTLAGQLADKVADGSGNFGFNAASDEYGDLVEMGILDATKVVRSALQNAASIAGLMVTAEAMVAEEPKEEKAPDMPGGGMSDMGY